MNLELTLLKHESFFNNKLDKERLFLFFDKKFESEFEKD